MNALSLLAVGGGAALGAWARWGLGIALNPLFPTLPLGTLAANVVGGLLMGCAMGLIAHYESLAPELRLFLTTGFLGGLTTFSTFSAESATLLLRGQWGWGAAHALLHGAGALLAVLGGIGLMRLVLRA
ncbi:MAG TPA: fluoride efflux transporter CrcB [Rhodanobacteraceae bacterium]|nr:fluoride efflux transporter CrcB [Rhodanobacteraceae bacterium]